MIYHVLNGDGLAGKFNLEGETIICREILIEGDLKAETLEDFWQARAQFIEKTFGDDSYFEKAQGEFGKLDRLKTDDEVNLWFGDEAFCQVNLWFILSLVAEKDAMFYRVFPDSEGWNCGFGNLRECFDSRESLSAADLRLASELWEAFSFKDFETLNRLGGQKSNCFKRLNEVCQALIVKESRPKEILSEITRTGETDFDKIFFEFQARGGVYGFSDLQVKNLLSEI